MQAEHSLSLETIRALLRRVSNRLVAVDIHPSMTLTEDLGLRSLELVSFIALCEKTFSIELLKREDILTSVKSVSDALKAIEAERSKIHETST
jgi:acyl carrier protein